MFIMLLNKYGAKLLKKIVKKQKKGVNVQIDILDDRLVVINLGFLIKSLIQKTLGKIAVRRNSLIADLFHRIYQCDY